jgi:hypothetical protein
VSCASGFRKLIRSECASRASIDSFIRRLSHAASIRRLRFDGCALMAIDGHCALRFDGYCFDWIKGYSSLWFYGLALTTIALLSCCAAFDGRHCARWLCLDGCVSKDVEGELRRVDRRSHCQGDCVVQLKDPIV